MEELAEAGGFSNPLLSVIPGKIIFMSFFQCRHKSYQKKIP